MKKWFTRLGWLDAISIFLLWMLLFREHRIFIALSRLSSNIICMSENEIFNLSNTFIKELSSLSKGNFFIISLFILLQGIKILSCQLKKFSTTTHKENT